MTLHIILLWLWLYSLCVFLFLKIKIRNGSCCHAIFAQNPASNSLPSSTSGKATHKTLPLEKGESKYILKEVIVSWQLMLPFQRQLTNHSYNDQNLNMRAKKKKEERKKKRKWGQTYLKKQKRKCVNTLHKIHSEDLVSHFQGWVNPNFSKLYHVHRNRRGNELQGFPNFSLLPGPGTNPYIFKHLLCGSCSVIKCILGGFKKNACKSMADSCQCMAKTTTVL